MVVVFRVLLQVFAGEASSAPTLIKRMRMEYIPTGLETRPGFIERNKNMSQRSALGRRADYLQGTFSIFSAAPSIETS
jgi:hypothetical protein